MIGPVSRFMKFIDYTQRYAQSGSYSEGMCSTNWFVDYLGTHVYDGQRLSQFLNLARVIVKIYHEI